MLLDDRSTLAYDAHAGDRRGTSHGPEPLRQSARDPRAAGDAAQRAELADRGAAADADEQPRSRGRREPAGAGGLRRHRPRGARLALLRRAGRDAEDARRRRDAARPVRQAGRRVPDPCRCAAGADRQLQPGRALGDLGQVPRARPHRPDDVRPDDRGLLDLHRQPGDHPGHLRDLRRGRAPALRRRSARQMDPDRRARRHGRRAAARRDDGGRVAARGRVPGEPDRAPPREPLSRPHGERPRRGARPDRRELRRRVARCRSGCSATPPRSFPSWSAAACGPTS